MSIRVISGTARGTKLKLVPGDSTRPIMDRVKESLFNIIGRDVLDSSWLDLFAGTGSVGIEAISRGAGYALLIDIEARAVRTMQDNLQATRLADRATVRKQDAFQLLRGRPERAFDFVYIAPPQYQHLWTKALEHLEANSGWVAENGQVIVQIDPTERADVGSKEFILVDERRYGSTLLQFFQRHAPEMTDMHESQTNAQVLSQLEILVDELIQQFAITSPPVPVERMLQDPKAGMWREIDIAQISMGFLKVTSPFSPRMSLARFLGRVIAQSDWAVSRGMPFMTDDDPIFQKFARMIVMPARMIQALGPSDRTPQLMSTYFEVPLEDASLRLEDLKSYST
ncbi:MAG: 16S rRNA (guanine(966)-N(2))-methyltransferase RsmD [Chloroflexi bacterium]|nr:16S rRNA (guanine(966)-N(2))-methyltransferase RsmD [Chloroflexota bacterium]